MISIHNGRSRSLGKGGAEEVYVQVSVTLRKYLHLFKGAKFGVFMAIALHSDKHGWSRPPTRLLRRETGYNKDTIFNALTELCELEIEGHRVLLRKGTRKLGGEFSANNYLIFPTPEEVEKYETQYLPFGGDEPYGGSGTTSGSSTVTGFSDTVKHGRGKSRTPKKPETVKTGDGKTRTPENPDAEVDPDTQVEPSSSSLDFGKEFEEQPHTPNKSADRVGKSRDGVCGGSKFNKPTLETYAWAKMHYYDAINAYLGARDKKYQPVRTIDNPGGWAEYARRTGNHDAEVQEWLNDPSIFDFEKWRRDS